MPRVLVVEDEPSQQVLVGAILTDEGYEFCMVDSLAALAAHGKVEPHQHDMIMTDMKLADGAFSVPEVRELGEREGVPVLVVSGSRDAALTASAEGVAFVSKPYEIDDLMDAIRGLAPPP